MKKTMPCLAILLALATIFAQLCVTASANADDLRVRNLETRMTVMERDMKAIIAQNKGQAQMGLTLDSIEAQMLQIKGHLEENNRQLREMDKKIKEGDAALDKQMGTRIQDKNNELKTQIDTKLAEMQANLEKLANLLNSTVGEIDTLKQLTAKAATDQASSAAKAARTAQERAEQQKELATAAAKEAPAKTTPAGLREIAPEQTKKKMTGGKATAATPPPTATATAKDDDTESPKGDGSKYDKALTLYRDHKYKEAYSAFLDFLDKEPKGEMAPNARFWVGDCLFKQREYELAILEYQKVIADYPKHAKAPAALLKQGLAFERLKDVETAKLVYKKLVEDFPKSDQADTAKKWIESH